LEFIGEGTKKKDRDVSIESTWIYRTESYPPLQFRKKI
jgi:hypothetical protein